MPESSVLELVENMALAGSRSATRASPGRRLRTICPPPTVIEPRRAGVALHNVCAMHVLERVAASFNQANLPLLLLKGAALNLTLYERPDERPMTDIDVLVRREQVDQACVLLEQSGCRRGAALVRADFFPRYHYETEYFAGQIYPIKIDLHVRPFRPLRYGRLLPPDAFWTDARPVRLGAARVLVPCPEDMLIHLAVHVAVHGSSRDAWLTDIERWVEVYGEQMDWNRLLKKVEAWHLALPVREALTYVAWERGVAVPAAVVERLQHMPANWRDRLTLWQAPRDLNHPVAHVLVDLVGAPGYAWKCGYLLALLFPGRAHMEQWYPRRHRLWLPCAQLVRWLWPLLRRTRAGSRAANARTG